MVDYRTQQLLEEVTQQLIAPVEVTIDTLTNVSTIIKDVDFDTSQTDNLNVEVQNASIPVTQSGTWIIDDITNPIETDTIITDVATGGTQTDFLGIDLNQIGNNTVQTSNGGAGSGTLRVAIAGDNNDVPIKNGVGGDISVDLNTISATLPTFDSNVVELAGNAINTNVGSAMSGTQRVVLSGSYESTTKTDLAQVNGSTVQTGTGSDAGCQRVVLANGAQIDVTIVSPIQSGAVQTSLSFIDGSAIQTGDGTEIDSQRVVLSNDYISTTKTDQTLIATNAIETASGIETTGVQRVIKAQNANKYYMKGYTELISGATFTTLGSIFYPNIFLLAANSAIQLSSANAGDTSTVLVIGFDSAWNPVSETYVLTGQTAVTKATVFFRINQMRIISGAVNIGAIYASIAGAPLVLGVPSVATDYLYEMQPGDGVSQLAAMSVPLISGSFLQPIRVIYSGRIDSGDTVNAQFQMKPAVSPTWGTEFKFWFEGDNNSQFEWCLDGIPPIPNTLGFDMRIQASEGGVGTSSLSTALSVELINTL